jgi:hypothetical protein
LVGKFNYQSEERAISLGTAIAISGAAANPNMGYHSSTFVTFLMTLFNVRLGAWLGNPGRHGADKKRITWDKASPTWALVPLLQEAMGLTDDRRRWVNLSDGGHFENLGIYEMVRRRCHLIIASDASADPTASFDDLGNAVRKIGIDMAVPIEFNGAIPIYPRKGEKIGSYCALGTIRYTLVDVNDWKDGVLVYIKPAFYGAEPIDVFNYARGADAFPHETTADQFFTESQLESYRALGSHVVERMSGGYGGGLRDTPMTVDEFLASAAEHICKQAEMARSSAVSQTDPAGPP